MKVYELLSEESKWTKRALARDIKGIEVDVNSVEAVSWCLIGALRKCYKTKYPITMFHMMENIVTWQNKPECTFKEVQSLIIKLQI